ncbi:MAG TPA: glycosyl hydrolase family 18 protein [Trebonia sp.]|nr:glycosyl hydrolase family 18 protein [Trebonia sp.]
MSGKLLAVLMAVLAIPVGAGIWLAAGGPGPGTPGGAGAGPGVPVASPGALPSLDLGTLPDAGPAPRPAACGSPSLAGANGTWLPDWLDDPSRPSLIYDQARRLRVLDLFWLRLGAAPGSLLVQPGNPGATSLGTALSAAAAASPCGLRFITVNDEQVPASVMAQILLDPVARWRNVTALAQFTASYPQADGLTLDYEYALPASQADLDAYAAAGHWHGLSVREETGRITAGYTELVRELALAMHRQHRLLRVTAMARTTDETHYGDVTALAPFLYDYGELAKYADQVIVMAIDFHWSTSDPGPVVTLADLKSVLSELRSYRIPAARLAVEVPAYGYDWTVDSAGHRLAGTEALTVSATDVAGHDWQQAGTKDGETSYQYTAGGRRHVVWFAGTALKYEASQLRTLCPGCGVMAWATGNTDPAGSALITAALGG